MRRDLDRICRIYDFICLVEFVYRYYLTLNKIQEELLLTSVDE
jgi:hypothetical protein